MGIKSKKKLILHVIEDMQLSLATVPLYLHDIERMFHIYMDMSTFYTNGVLSILFCNLLPFKEEKVSVDNRPRLLRLQASKESRFV